MKYSSKLSNFYFVVKISITFSNNFFFAFPMKQYCGTPLPHKTPVSFALDFINIHMKKFYFTKNRSEKKKNMKGLTFRTKSCQ